MVFTDITEALVARRDYCQPAKSNEIISGRPNVEETTPDSSKSSAPDAGTKREVVFSLLICVIVSDLLYVNVESVVFYSCCIYYA